MRRINNFSRVVACLSLTLFTLPGIAVDQFIKDKEEGWFWYEVEPEPEIPEKVDPPKPMPPAKPTKVKELEPPKVKSLSVEWFQQEYPKIMNIAIDDPSTENMQKYRYATRVMLDKASNFAHSFQRQSLLDPLLDESVRSPFSTSSRGSFQRLSEIDRKKATDYIAQKAGIWVFLDDTCTFCALQYPLVARTVKERGLTAVYITPDGKRPSWMSPSDQVLKDAGQSKYLRIGVRPAIALVVPPAKITVLTQGMLSQDLLEERILHAGDEAGLLPEEMRKLAFPNQRGLLTTQDIKDIGNELQENPDALTPNVQQRIEKRY